MKMTVFAAIDIGSYEVGMKIYEISIKNGMREIDYIRRRIELGKEAFADGRISPQKVDELCRILTEFAVIMKGYRTDASRVCATSALRESENLLIILDQIRVRTGFAVEILSNSEQRFLGYKSIASKGNEFNKIIQKGIAIVDIGGGSTQISLFDKDSLVTTQNIRLGTLRMRQKLSSIIDKTTRFEEIVEELVNREIYDFKKLFLKDREIKNIIAVSDYIKNMVRKANEGQNDSFVTREKYMEFFGKIRTMNSEQMSTYIGVPSEGASLIMTSAIVYKRLFEELNAELIWAPGVNLDDGIAYDFAVGSGLIQTEHDFENDILAAAKNIGKRYMYDKGHSQMLEKLTTEIFDRMKKIHGLSKRERLLLQIAAILHDCGKYISMSSVSDCSYNIIMSTEIIGISHREREVVANVVKYMREDFRYYEEINEKIDVETYLLIAKLTAILRTANALDRSHKQKFKDIKVVLKEKQLVITVDTIENIDLESGLFNRKTDFFEEVYSMKPVIKQRKGI
ncbi:Ppx/GppA phosphatase family protein [Anaerobium acetethylicum]|nr:HD domain-containing protein [Anaerobium acetethylicum]